MEKGKEARCSRRRQSRGWRRARCRRSGPTSSPRWWRRPPQARQRRQAGGWRRKRRVVARGTPAWPEKEESLSLSSKIFFWKITSSPVMRRKEEKWSTAGRGWRRTPMRRRREVFNNWTMLRVTFFLYPSKGKVTIWWTLRVRMRKDFDPCGFCGRHLVQAVDLYSHPPWHGNLGCHVFPLLVAGG